MRFNAEWITHKGTLTDDNRDYCSIALRRDAALYVVTDGSTKSNQSGTLASEFVRMLADRFIAEPFLSSADDVAAYLREVSEYFKTIYPAGRLSFCILLDVGGGSVFALHAGDCRLGRLGTDGEVIWITRAHTLANALEDIDNEALADHPDRHVLTRCLKPGKPCEVEISEYSLTGNERLLVATDGYWADLDHRQQSDFIANSLALTEPEHDDVSCLVLSRLVEGSAEDATHQGSDNFYFVSI